MTALLILLRIVVVLEVIWLVGFMIWELGRGMTGATAYEARWGRFGVRVLRPKFYFWPHHVGKHLWAHSSLAWWRGWVFPRFISFYIDRRNHEES